ncbi:MAG: DUF6316 family protein [Halioglobus sp.]|nr:DUF6316 family protein [Halioglobus sp.]
MSKRRDDEASVKSHFRTERFFQEGGSWFFLTREGTLEGPFADRRAAEHRLETYIRVMETGWADNHKFGDLEVAPKEPSKDKSKDTSKDTSKDS